MKSVILCVVLLLVSVVTYAKSPPENIDLSSVLKLVQDASPRLNLERQNIALAEADKVTASAHPNPIVSINRSDQPGASTNYDGRRANEISVEMPLLVGGQRAARMYAASKSVDAALARVGATGNDLATEVGVAYVGLLLAQQKSRTLLTSVDELDKLRHIIAERQKSGLASEYELLRVDVEQVALSNRTTEAESDIAESQAKLAILLGFQNWHPVGIEELRPLPVTDSRAQVSNHPEVLAAVRDEEASQAMIDVADRERYPNVSMNLDRFWTSNPYSQTYTLGVAVEIPIFDSRLGALNKAKAEAGAAGLRRYLTESKVNSDLSNYSKQVAQRTLALERFNQQTGARLGDLKRMAEDSYRLGRSSITELLDATRSRIDTQISQYELIAGLMEAQLRLMSAQGQLIKSVHEN